MAHAPAPTRSRIRDASLESPDDAPRVPLDYDDAEAALLEAEAIAAETSEMHAIMEDLKALQQSAQEWMDRGNAQITARHDAARSDLLRMIAEEGAHQKLERERMSKSLALFDQALAALGDPGSVRQPSVKTETS